jgi:hypothetical protein
MVLRKSGVIFLTFLTVLLPGFLFAQIKQPHELRKEMADAKAERYARLQMVEAAQTPNQLDYDVVHYFIDVDLDPTTDTVTGTVTMTAEVLSTSLNQADVDLLSNMTVTQVTGTGGPLVYSHASDIVTVTLDRTYITGELFTFTIDYNGTPDPAVDAFAFAERSSQPMIWSLSEPFGARSWWPCKDISSDKADSVDVRVTIPAGLIVASNGTLRSTTNNGATDTYWWHEEYPIATYLVSVAIHPYTTFSHWYHYSPTDSMEVQYYVFPDHYDAVQTNYAKTVPMIELFAGLFGEYPFLNEKYGHAEFTWGGGMEHQTITSMGGYSEYLIAHELAHQWWGDMVTCDDFHHIWLNEGFATYSEALWSEGTYGIAQYHQDMFYAKYLGGGTIYVPDTGDWNRIFHSGLSYNKGSWVLHMLRHVVGDTTFFSILQTYYADPQFQYGTATTEQFRDLCESVSGMDLDAFFHQWIYEEYYPEYQYEWSAAENGGFWDVDLTIDQLQTHHTYWMPIDVRISTAAGDTTLAVWDSLATQQFTLTVAAEPTGVALDPDEWILRTVDELVTNPTLDSGILVVNGVDFDTYGSEIWTAYEDSVFWGNHPITFWDCFDETGSGYPPNVPTPLGHGPVPSSTIGQFSAVVWVGNHYNGDISSWYDTSIKSYLEAGGNVLLMSRRGQDFITETLRQYLGITWQESQYNTLNNCISTYPGLTDIALNSAHTYCAVFDTALATGETTLLFKETTSFSTHRGLGAWRNPAAGGTHRSDGGQFVFISGRPYRYDHDDLRGNVDYILSNFFGEPYTPPTGVAAVPRGPAFALRQNFPNPFNPHTMIKFSVPEKRLVSLRVYDVSGRLVATLADREYPTGTHAIEWDGTNRLGVGVASGIYFYKIVAGRDVATRKMLLLR